MNGSDTLAKFLLAVGKPEKYSQRQQVEHRGSVNIDHEIRIGVIEDDGWYGNKAHSQAAARLAASDPGAALPGPVQGGSVRPAVGQNGHGSNGHG